MQQRDKEKFAGLKVGIDAIAMYTPRYVFDLNKLALQRGVAEDKFALGLGQHAMSVPPPGEDIITMATNAARKALQNVDVSQVDWILFATESGVDLSKSAGIYVHELLKLPKRCRVVELKQACYSATAAIQLALPYLRENPDKKILLVASDIARYGLLSNGESSQGAGACAMVLSANPRILAFDKEYGAVTESVMDFWRPLYLKEALVEGKYSSKLYLNMLEATWQQYTQESKRQFDDHDYYIYHTPVPRLVEKAHAYLAKINGRKDIPDTEIEKQVAASLQYGRQVGNCYSAALYIGFASLLDHASENLSGKRIGFYSYGSGCVAEFFSGVIQAGYQAQLHTDYHAELIASRVPLSYAEYETFYKQAYPEDGSDHTLPLYDTAHYRLTGFKQHKRLYSPVEACVTADA